MMVVFGAVDIEVDGSKRLADVELLTRKVEMVIHSKIPYIKKISVIPHSMTSLSVSQNEKPKKSWFLRHDFIILYLSSFIIVSHLL